MRPFMCCFISKLSRNLFASPKHIQNLTTSLLPHCYHLGLSHHNLLPGQQPHWTPGFYLWSSLVWLPQSSQGYFNNTSQPCTSCAQHPPMTSVLLRIKAKMPTVAHKVLHNLSPLSVSCVPLSFSFCSSPTQASRPFPGHNSHPLTPGPLHWLFHLPATLSPRYLHASLPHLLQMSPSQCSLPWRLNHRANIQTSLVVRWLRIHLPVGHRFDPWSGKILHTAERPSPCTTITEPTATTNV